MNKLILSLTALVMFSTLAFAQTAAADLYGRVVDTGGSAVSGVEVYLTGDVVGQKSVLSSAAGNFRFIKLAPGKYQLELKKAGFQTVIYKEIRMLVGKNKYLRIQMPAGSADPPLEMTDDRPIDTRRTTTAANITEEQLQSLPTARNPWTILRLVPGMMLDREDVAGSESGQQSSFFGLGASKDDITWYLDAANDSDPAAIGAAPAYFNTNSFEEIQVTMGANDVTSYTGGPQLNFVRKRGGNRYSGDIYIYGEEDIWEMNQSLPTSITDEGWGSPGISRLYQYGANFGGPIIRDKLWFYGSYGVQDIRTRTIVQTQDTTWLCSKYIRLDFQFGTTWGSLNFHKDEKKKWGRTSIGPESQAPSTYWNQSGPGRVYQAVLNQEFGGLLLSGQVSYTDGGFKLVPQTNDINPATGHLEGLDWYLYRVPSQYWEGSIYLYSSNRDSMDVSLDGNFFAEGVLGGDHEIRFGVDYYHGCTTSQSLYPNQRVLMIHDRFNPAGYKEIWWRSDGVLDVDMRRISAYFSDTANFGRLTVNLGLRYDRETAHNNALTAPGLTFDGTPIFVGYMGDLNIPARNIAAAYELLSPRISLTYDLFGSGRNVLKASFARYGSQSGNRLATFQWINSAREIDVFWNDDGDLIPEWGEWSEDPADWLWWNVNMDDPYTTINANQFDPGFNSPLLTEFSFSFEKALGADLVLALNAYYKRMTNLMWTRGLFSDTGEIETAGNWYLAGTYTFDSGKTTDYYLRYSRPDASYRTNYGSGTYNIYTALQLVFSKKLSHGWMLDASFTWSDWQQHLDRAETFDLTNFYYFDGGAFAYQSGGQGLSDVYVNSRWQLKIAGLVQLPWGINLTGVFQAREGYIVPYYEFFYRPGVGWTKMYEPDKKFGDDRLPDLWVLNLGLEKTFRISPSTNVTLFVDGYNITNNATTLKVNPVLGTSTTGDILRVLNPGIFQFGIRVSL